jgi:excisionase family DNA binding protein
VKLIDVKILSSLLSIKPKTLYSWTNSRGEKLPHYRLGKLIRYDFDEVLEWLRKKHKQETVNEDNA